MGSNPIGVTVSFFTGSHRAPHTTNSAGKFWFWFLTCDAVGTPGCACAA